MFRKTVLPVLILVCIVVPGFAQPKVKQTPLPQKSQTALSGTDLYRHVAPSVVTLLVYDRSGKQIKFGSGVIISSDGSILTNYHVVEDGYFLDVRVLDDSGKPQLIPARPLRGNKDQDLAVVSMATNFPLKVAIIATNLPKAGSKVYAIGSPLDLDGSISEGIVSQLRKDSDVTLIQTTAAISPGSSGGGLFLDTGELVGITAMTLKSGQGLNFAISCLDLSSLVPIQSFAAKLSSMPPEKSSPSIFIAGIEIFLGMKKKDLESRIASPYFLQSHRVAGAYGINKINIKANRGYDRVGDVTFEDEKVVWAQKDLDIEGDPVLTVRALFKSVFANVPGGRTNPTVRTRSFKGGMQIIDLLFDSGIIVRIIKDADMLSVTEVISIWGDR